MAAARDEATSLALRWPFKRCVKFGFGLGCAYAVLAVGVYASVDDFTAYYGIPILAVVLVDITGGLVGGAVVGWLLPRLKGPVSYSLLAAIAIAPSYAVFAVVAGPDSYGTPIDGLLAAMVVGGFLGVGIWHREVRSSGAGSGRGSE